jgi:hypothetical protein
MPMSITHLDGKVFDLDNESFLSLISFDKSSLYFDGVTDKVDGRPGLIDLGVSVGYRQMKAVFNIKAANADDYPQRVNRLFRIFDSKNAFYLKYKKEPFRRILVRANNFTPEQITPTIGTVEITFVALFPYWESINSINGTNFTSNEIALWEFDTDGGPTPSPADLVYTKTLSTNPITFTVNNYSAIDIDPRYVGLVITHTGASTNLKIENLTTGDTWQYTGTTIAGDVLELNGVKSLKNGISVFANTNKKLLRLQKGANSIKVTGSTVATNTLKFDFRFYYR